MYVNLFDLRNFSDREAEPIYCEKKCDNWQGAEQLNSKNDLSQ